MRVLLLSTYELGRQPFGLASPAAWLAEAGADVTCVDLAHDELPLETVRRAEVVAFHLPMHTATRLAIPVITRVRALNPSARLCAYGLYGPPNRDLLRSLGVETVLGGEFEADLVALVTGRPVAAPSRGLPRLEFRVPYRGGLPPLTRYATLHTADDGPRVVGYTEASRGCKHRCRHCPVVPVYDGRFRIVPTDVVMADIAAQVEAGAQHITFGDPDFFNGIGHASDVVAHLARRFPDLTYDVTIKIEHLRRHDSLLPRLRDTGCLFITSAVESMDDHVLARLEKGHTAADFLDTVERCREIGLVLVPTFVAFTPWTTVDGYVELLAAIARLDLIEQVAPIQLAIRLLIPGGSRLLELPEIQRVAGAFDPTLLVHPWRHPDPRVDRLQRDVGELIGTRLTASRREVFEALVRSVSATTGRPVVSLPSPARNRASVPYLNEPWYC